MNTCSELYEIFIFFFGNNCILLTFFFFNNEVYDFLKSKVKKNSGKEILITKPIIKTRRDLGFKKKKKNRLLMAEGGLSMGKSVLRLAEKPELTHFSFGSNHRAT